jgi:WD40 repeat protein
LAFSPDGHLLAGASGGDLIVPIWDLDSGTQVRQLDHPNSAVAVAFQPNSQVLAVADNDQRQGVRLWDLDGSSLPHSLHSSPPSYGSAVAFSPDGQTLATRHANGRLHLWNVREERITHSLRVADRNDVLAVAFSPDGRILASIVYLPRDGFMVSELQLWNPRTGDRLSLSTNTDLTGKFMAFDPAEPQLALARGDGIAIWKVKASQK